MTLASHLPPATIEKVSVDVRHWESLRRSLRRMMVSHSRIAAAAETILARCSHMAGCPVPEDFDATCLPDCPDRETRLDARVILASARAQHMGDFQLPPREAGTYMPPVREYFDAIVAQLTALRELVRDHGLDVTEIEPPPPTEPAPPEVPEEILSNA